MFWDDLDADFRRFYQIHGIGDGDYGDLSGSRFIALAERCIAYDGALTNSLRILHRRDQQQPETASDIPATKAAVGTHADLRAAKDIQGRSYPPVFEVRESGQSKQPDEMG